MVDSAADWPWSSYRAHCGLAASPPWLDTAALHGYPLGCSARTASGSGLVFCLPLALPAEPQTNPPDLQAMGSSRSPKLAGWQGHFASGLQGQVLPFARPGIGVGCGI